MPKPKGEGIDVGLIFGGKPKGDDEGAEGEGDSFAALAETALGSGDMATRADALKQAIKMCMAGGDDEAAEGETGEY
jgi:hypothetical protein